MSEQVKQFDELREAAGDHAHDEGYLAGLLKRRAAAIKAVHAEAEAMKRTQTWAETELPKWRRLAAETRIERDDARMQVDALRAENERLRADHGVVAHANLLRAQKAEAELEALRSQHAERPLVEALEHYANCGRSGYVARVALAAYRKEPGK